MVDKTQFENLDRGKHGKLIQFMENSFKSMEIGGKNIIQTPDGEFIEYILMDEEYFVENWLTQFAIGQVGDKNYFNHQEWSRMTDGFTKGAIILNAEKQPVCLIRKFIDIDLNYMQQHYMTQSAREAAQAKFIPNKDEADGLVNTFAERVTTITSQNPDYDTLTSMIPMDYYLSRGVDPNVLKQIIYIRDTYTIDGQPIEPDCPKMDQIEKILYKYARSEFVSAQDKALVLEVTNGDFIFDETTNKVEDKKQPESDLPDDDFDPLAD